MKLTVLAAGAWGTALALAFAPRHAVTLWAREPQLVADLKNERENRRFLPGFAFPDSLAVEGDFVRAVEATELVVLATPLAGLRSTLKQLRGARPDLPPLLWVCKGLEAGSAKLPHQVVADELGASAVCGVLTGPSFAEEARHKACRWRSPWPRATALSPRPRHASCTARVSASTPTTIWSGRKSAGR